MSYERTLSNLREDLRGRAHLFSGSGGGPVLDSEMNYIINSSYGKFHDLVISLEPRRYVKKKTYTTTADSGSYLLPSDFLHARGIDVQEGNYWYQIDRGDWTDRNINSTAANIKDTQYDFIRDELMFYPAPGGAFSIRMYYIPSAATASADTDTYDFFNAGWDDYVMNDASITCLAKTKKDPSYFIMLRNEAMERIKKSVRIDINQPLKRRWYHRDTVWWRRYRR